MSDTTTQAIESKGHGFGTMPVFLAAISTILGAIMFLRFGWAVGNQGIWGAILIIIVGHAITIPTALAISEIATNRKVEGGGEYFIISRSFGTNIGASIGIALYLSQAISVAFYLIAFAQAFQPVFPLIKKYAGFTPIPQMFSFPMGALLLWLVLKKGANLGVLMLYGVVVILAISIVLFFAGGSWNLSNLKNTSSGIPNGASWAFVFSVCFPAFTGMTAGVGLSGDLKNPRRSIPLGTMIATLTGALVYFLIVLKLATNSDPATLNSDELVMSRIALWGPIIPIGLAAATLSSAIGSLLIAPRTLQALTSDRVFPTEKMNNWLSAGVGNENEPRNATYVTAVITMVIIALGDVNLVAGIVSQFFMVTYGAICLISVLEHFAASPSYRPSFRSRWWISLIGAVGCAILMLMMEIVTAIVAIGVMVLIYISMRRTSKEERGIAVIFKGALYQAIRRLQVWLQKNRSRISGTDWRPSFIAISGDTFTRIAAFDLLKWIAHRYGFGTYFHYVKGRLNREIYDQSVKELEKVIKLSDAAHSGVYAGTIISPSFVTAVAQIIQVPGVAGMENNGLILEFSRDRIADEPAMKNLLAATELALSARFNVCIQRSSEYRCGYKTSIHIWLTRSQLSNANLMILLAYIIMGHPEWDNSEIFVYAVMPHSERETQKKLLHDLVNRGRLPISIQNINVLPWASGKTYEQLIYENSLEADLVIMGFNPSQLEKYGAATFTRFSELKDVIFVRAEADDIALVEAESAAIQSEHVDFENECITRECSEELSVSLSSPEIKVVTPESKT
ncbi:amino acid permease [Myxococcota bacterium]|nr:amino acid permease [Myxococcota bacterium]MBU1379802.1 amino acid permease [Myxococcota bacterium]MBU1497124.1 amino acid permease [Myxococcota bacterium]